jgi:2,3-bisphosphoglycerate-dependent phosphoglycerate mutase
LETILYFVRHAESVFVEGKERSRGLTAQGTKDAQRVTVILRSEDIDLFYSSPYERSIETIRPAAKELQKVIYIEEDLRERSIGDFTPATFRGAKQRVFEDMHFYFPGGESGVDAQRRAVSVVKSIVNAYKGKKIVIGTHGDIMTLMLNFCDKRYGYAFWESTSMPDIYKLRLEDSKLREVTRLW